MRTAFRPLIAAAQDARRQILKEFSQVPKEIQAAFAGLGRAQGSTFRGATVEAQRANRELVAAARTAAREQLQIERDLERQRVLAVRTANREMLKEHREAARQEQALAREAASNARRAERELDRFATRTSHRATRFLAPTMPVASIARRAAGEVVRGFGIDPTVSGSFQRNIDLETSAVNLTNQARLNGQDISSGSVQGAVRGIQKKYGTDQGETSGALEQYQKLTGDLGGGLEMLDELAKRSVTTGARLNDLAAAAGNISNNLGDVPNKAEAVLKVLDTMTVQGATGAVEISDLATQTAKLAAAAGQFGGNAGDNISKMVALAEIARAQGGAPGAAGAATAVGSFVNTLDKPARIKAFKAAGINLRDANNQLRDPFEIIKDVVRYTHGDTEKANAFIQDAAAKRVTRGFINSYNAAGGGAAGDRAMDALISKFATGGVSEQTRAANLQAHNESTEAQAKKLQAELDEVGRQLQAELLPPLRDAAPHLVKFVEAMGEAAKWALENPGKAITAAIVASIARAGIESALRKGIEDTIRGAAGAGIGQSGGVAGGIGAAAIGLGVGGLLAGGIYAEGVGAIDASEGRMKKAGAELNEFRSASANGKTIDPNRRAALFRKILDEREAIKAMEQRRANPLGNDFFDMSGQWDFIKSHLGMSNTDTEIKTRKAMLAEKESAYDKLKATKYESPDEVSRYRGKTADVTVAQMQAAFKQGGTAALEKIAVKTETQTNTAAQMLEQQKQANTTLAAILEKIKAPTGDNTPQVDTDSPAYQQ